MTGAVCNDPQFVRTENTQAAGGEAVSSATSVTGCQNYCRGNADCSGFDWDRGGQTCWAHINKNMDSIQTFSNTNVDLYSKTCSGEGESNVKH